MEFKKEFSFLLLLLVVGVTSYLFPGLLESRIFTKVIESLTIICALKFAKSFLNIDSTSGKLYDAGVSSLLIVVASIFLEKVLEILGVSIIYGMYLEGFGYLLAFILILIASINSISSLIKLQR